MIQLLTPGTVLIAAGQRLARYLAHQYARECRDSGLEVWETPGILTFGAWLGELWQDTVETGADVRLLLTPAQEAALWERAVAESSGEARLLSAAATAELAAQAWALLHAWRLPRTEIAKAGHEDVLAFVAWATVFEGWCDANEWLDSARLPDAVTALVDAGQVSLPARVVLAGFDELTPQQGQLFDKVRASGCEIVNTAGTDRPGKSHAVLSVLPSVADEIAAAARWARRQLEDDPHRRLGILAPDLAAQGDELRRVFDELLLPASMLPGQEEVTRPYNVSFGEPLARQPLVSDALAVLDIAHGPFPLSRLTGLLHSPFLAGADAEAAPRAALDVALRRDGDAEIDLFTFARSLGRRDDCPELAKRVVQFRERVDALPRTQSPSRWASAFAQLVTCLGWPGERSRSSSEHQIVEAWRKLLGQFGALDTVLPALRYEEALSRLRRMAQQALFQRETPETPVQILGVLEASGFSFDAVWVMGLHDEVWPAASKPNPFLPIALQRRHRVPHASAERELEFCSRLTQRLLHSAPEIVVSYPQSEEDRDLRPSPLVRSLPSASESVLTASVPRYRDTVHAASALESLSDERAPSVSPGVSVKGGTALFRAQSACPFRGFAEFRLRAREFPEPEPGLSPADRGNLVHDLLARVWQALGSQARLMEASTEQLANIAAQAAAEAVRRLTLRRPMTLTDRVAALERERLAALALEWLELEKTRAPFEVRREETSVHLRVGELRTDARIDRIDALPEGGFAVIDYKTGDARAADWFGERPVEPQLPLYALYGVPRQEVKALLYALVQPREAAFAGIAREAGIVSGLEAYNGRKGAQRQGTWSDLFDEWEAALTALADEYAGGYARVSPRDQKACQQCHLHASCRIYERRARLVDVGEGSDE